MVNIHRTILFPGVQRVDQDVLKVILISLGLAGLNFLLQGNIGITIGTEGWLWYGTIQTASGSVPIHDFQSYDPGRYYWGVLWSYLFGNGIIALRISSGIFQFLGLTFGLLALRRVIRPWWILAIAGLVLAIWMYPRHKYFEPCIAMAAIFFAVRLIESPSHKRHFLSGLFVGLAGFFGINHLLYNFLSFLLLILFVSFKDHEGELKNRLPLYLAGVVTGYSPIFVLMIIVPGFLQSFIERLLYIFTLFRSGYGNIPAPIPWPWVHDYSQISLLQGIRRFATGSFYIFLPLLYVCLAGNILLSKVPWSQRKGLLAAATFIGVMYLHYPFSCGDFPHFTQLMAPHLIALLSLVFVFRISAVVRGSILLFILVISLFLVGTAHPFYRKLTAPDGAFVNYDIAGDRVWIRSYKARLIDVVKQIDSQAVQAAEGLLFVPGWAGLYPILQREAPLRNLYFIFPESDEIQYKMVRQLQDRKVDRVILGDVPFGGLDKLRFRNSYRVLWQHFADNFEPVDVEGLPGDHRLLKRKQAGGRSPG